MQIFLRSTSSTTSCFNFQGEESKTKPHNSIFLCNPSVHFFLCCSAAEVHLSSHNISFSPLSLSSSLLFPPPRAALCEPAVLSGLLLYQASWRGFPREQRRRRRTAARGFCQRISKRRAFSTRRAAVSCARRAALRGPLGRGRDRP